MNSFAPRTWNSVAGVQLLLDLVRKLSSSALNTSTNARQESSSFCNCKLAVDLASTFWISDRVARVDPSGMYSSQHLTMSHK